MAEEARWFKVLGEIPPVLEETRKLIVGTRLGKASLSQVDPDDPRFQIDLTKDQAQAYQTMAEQNVQSVIDNLQSLLKDGLPVPIILQSAAVDPPIPEGKP